MGQIYQIADRKAYNYYIIKTLKSINIGHAERNHIQRHIYFHKGFLDNYEAAFI
jgi:hypothetical protein